MLVCLISNLIVNVELSFKTWLGNNVGKSGTAVEYDVQNVYVHAFYHTVDI